MILYNIIFHHTATALIYCPFAISGENDSFVLTSAHPRWTFIMAHQNPNATTVSIVIWKSPAMGRERERQSDSGLYWASILH